jgi:hypothetical protein
MKTNLVTLGAAQKSFGTRVAIGKWLVSAVIALLVLPSTGLVNGQGLLYTVTSTGDGGLVGSDAFCDDGTGHCTLRAAIEASNSHPGVDGIDFDIPTTDPGFDPATGVWTIILTKILPDISADVGITGPGANLLFVRPNTGFFFPIFNLTTTGTVTVTDLTLSNGLVGINNNNAATVNVINCTLRDNSTAAGFGGGIHNNSTGPVNVINSTLIGNSASSGGGIYNQDGTVTFTNSTLSSNSAISGFGGAIDNPSTGTVNVINSTLDRNTAIGGDGGGIFNRGTVTFTDSTLNANFAGTGSLDTRSGGGIFNQGGTVTILNSTLSANGAGDGSDAVGTGGGIHNDGGTVTFTNSTLSLSRPSGIFNAGTLNVSNSTISQCFTRNHGGGVRNEGTAQMKSSIIALNTSSPDPLIDPSPDDVSGPFTSAGFNLIGNEDGSTGFSAPTDQTGTTVSPLDPKLDPAGLQDNGGPTLTIALLFGSPAIDKGSGEVQPGLFLLTDQRGSGFPRTFDDPEIANTTGGDGTDIGAFEIQTAAPPPVTFGNISTRLRVETGDNVLIGGIIITGTQAKKVMVRAIGPSLPLADVLPDPILELHDGTGAVISSNDNWMDAPNKQEIIDSGIAPTNDFESAILMSLDPGLYTAIVRGVNDTTGIALVEAYDLDLSADAILANISTRGLVQTGDDVMIGGIIILGTDAQEVLLRAIGPSLSDLGVPDALADPILELHDKDGLIIATNDDWRSDQEAEIVATTIPPTDDAESAILMTLTPDAYTAIVRGKDNTTGVALVEAYQLDN